MGWPSRQNECGKTLCQSGSRSNPRTLGILPSWIKNPQISVRWMRKEARAGSCRAEHNQIGHTNCVSLKEGRYLAHLCWIQTVIRSTSMRWDLYLIPRMDECLKSIREHNVFSTLHANTGYWQVKIHDQDQNELAFPSHQRLYRFTRLSFGLRECTRHILTSERCNIRLCKIANSIDISIGNCNFLLSIEGMHRTREAGAHNITESKGKV